MNINTKINHNILIYESLFEDKLPKKIKKIVKKNVILVNKDFIKKIFSSKIN